MGGGRRCWSMDSSGDWFQPRKSSKVFNVLMVRVAQMIPAVQEEPNGVIQLYSSEKNARESSSLPELDQILVEPGMETKITTADAVQIQHIAVAAAWWLINRLVNCLEYPRTWSEDTRGMLMIVATMISTTTFQAAVDPPGGVWQDNNTNSRAGGSTYCIQNNICFAGTSVAGSLFPENFLTFVTFNGRISEIQYGRISEIQYGVDPTRRSAQTTNN
ncbi:unnamed protein product [Prunus armeniaca]